MLIGIAPLCQNQSRYVVKELPSVIYVDFRRTTIAETNEVSQSSKGPRLFQIEPGRPTKYYLNRSKTDLRQRL